MKNNYQLGTDDDWLKISNDELAQIIKKRDRQIAILRTFLFVLFLVLGWIVFKYSKHLPLSTLWT